MTACRTVLPAACATALLALMAGPADAQWLSYPSSGVPRTAEGKTDLSAPAPKTSEGVSDLSGIWLPDPGPRATVGIGDARRSPYFIDVTADLKPEDVPFQPAAAAEYKRRVDRQGKDDPTTRCQPTGVPSLDTYPFPFKVVQMPSLVIILYENNTDFRQIFIDGRRLPEDPQPTWMGYSVGRWDGDTLVVDTVGFTDRSWLDRSGHPHSESLHLTERFRRLDVGRMEIAITIDDPKAYTKPITFTQPQRLLADTELLEHFCTDNEKYSNARP